MNILLRHIRKKGYAEIEKASEGNKNDELIDH